LSTFVIRLRGPEDLFDRPVFDWKRPPAALVAGATRAVVQLEARSDGEPPLRFRFEFSEPLPADAARGLHQALEEYCRQTVVLHRTLAEDSRRRGWRSLRLGSFALVIALGLSTGLRHWHPLPPLLNELFSEGFVILGWVVLWNPLEQLIYDGVPHRQQARLFERLARCEFEFVPAA
jgi:hypothetical protein